MKRIVVIGASAGGIDVLRTMLGALPKEFPAPIVIVVHTSPQAPGVLDDIFGRASVLPVSYPYNGERLRNGHVYVAPPDHHVVVEPGVLRLTHGPRENRFRPAIDPLFRSAAQVYGPGAIGVVLSGFLDDGTAGLAAIKQLGGTAVVQDPDDAAYPSMPRSALRRVNVDYAVPASRLASLLVELAGIVPEVATAGAAPDPIDVEVKIAKEENPLAAELGKIASPSEFTCPDLPRRPLQGEGLVAHALPLSHRSRVLERGPARRHRRGDRQIPLELEKARRLTEQMETVRAMVRSRDTVIADTGTGS